VTDGLTLDLGRRSEVVDRLPVVAKNQIEKGLGRSRVQAPLGVSQTDETGANHAEPSDRIYDSTSSAGLILRQDQAVMDATICAAIKSRSIITFRYDEAVRRVEPHQVGYDHDGDLTLSAWQLSGGSGVDWRDFHIAKMSGLSTTAEHFSGPRPGYNPRNRKMHRVLCGL